MRPSIVDGAHSNWENELRIILFARQDADLIHCSPQHVEECERMAIFAIMELKIDPATQIATFRRRVR
jgi:hypothetical protein